ncbi:MAG: NAD(P)H-hydrate dehydratase, partial [Synergistaceae bacterium]|nr:NAD(P)H-hydrate dehydratase [Synergistaceae bacterium]
DMLLTPHEGEAARLLGLEPDEVKSERSASVRKLAEKWGTVLLKGRETLVDDGRRTFLVAEGNRSLAVPGSGDVLAGISAFFISSGISIHPAASLAAFIHGRAGNRISTEKGLDGVLASEIADVVPQVLREMRQNRFLQGFKRQNRENTGATR